MSSRRRRLCVLGAVLLVPLVFGLLRLRFDGEVLNLLPAKLSVVHGLRTYQEHFSSARELIITVEGGERAKVGAATRAIAEKLRELTNEISRVTWRPPWIERPEQASELIAYLWLNQEPADFGSLTNRLCETNLSSVLEATREELATTLSPTEIARLGYDPYGLTRLPAGVLSGPAGFEDGEAMFSSAEGTFRIIFVKSSRDLIGYRECSSWFETVQKAARSATPKEVSLGFTGRPAFVAEISGGMKRDIIISVFGTGGIIALLFWLAHRRWKPMLWLLSLLAFVLIATLAVGGILFGTIHVISVGFAAILLGLAVDYAVVHYQEALAHPGMTVPQIRRAIAPSIFWAAVTTISAFLVLNFGGLPGLAQLGTLVAIGVSISAVVMIFAFLPPLFPQRMGAPGAPNSGVDIAATYPLDPGNIQAPQRSRTIDRLAIFLAAALLAGCLTVLWLRGSPELKAGAEVMRGAESKAFAALDAIQARLNQNREPLCLTIAGRDEGEVARKLAVVETTLQRFASNGTLQSVVLPTGLWPQPQKQAANREAARQLASRRESLREAATTAGFSTDSFALTDRLLDNWKYAAAVPGTIWPTNPLCSWILEKFAARGPTNFVAAGFLFTSGSFTNSPPFEKLATDLAAHGVHISGWQMLNQALLQVVEHNFWKLVLPIMVLVLASLGLAFRSLTEVLLCIAVLAVSGVCLLAGMRLMNWSWNLLNLMAVPLILGTGVDYSIFMLLALRRFQGNPDLAHQSVGRALLLCGGTAVSGFGCLGLSSNAGMASLGQVCALGIAANIFLAVYILPGLWLQLAKRPKAEARLALPSSFYSAAFWQAGLFLARRLPLRVSTLLAVTAARAYFALIPGRAEVVVQNLLPPLRGNRATAERTARQLFANFARKLLDLWRYEAGVRSERPQWSGWELFQRVYSRGKGVLVVTAHLGNWELGAELFLKQKISLLVLTQAEPDARLTELRRMARTRRGVETLVVGEDAFALIEVIKRLQAGGVVALLVDRPPSSKAVEIEMFGSPFNGSIVAAELARASGCGILSSSVVFNGKDYHAAILQEIPYKQEDISNRDERVRLTREILRALEPVIMQHLDQWYHFVPIWKQTERVGCA